MRPKWILVCFANEKCILSGTITKSLCRSLCRLPIKLSKV